MAVYIRIHKIVCISIYTECLKRIQQFYPENSYSFVAHPVYTVHIIYYIDLVEIFN